MQTRTTTALLEGLATPGDEEAWAELDARYRPVLVGLARRVGLSGEDAADAAQETLLRFLRAYRAGTYRRDRGRLRSWLLAIARNCIADAGRARSRRIETPAGTQVERAAAAEADAARLDAAWEEERERAILDRALRALEVATRFEEATIEAFRGLLRGEAAPDVAARLDIPVERVHLARHRCLQRLQPIVAELERTWDDGPEELGP